MTNRDTSKASDAAGGTRTSLRAKLIACSIEILEVEGLEALTLRAAARAAGVSHMAPYRHFTDKEALLASVAETGFRDLATQMNKAATAGSKPKVKLKAIGRAYVRFAVRRPALYRLMFGPAIVGKGRFPGLTEAGNTAFQCCADAVTAALQGGRMGRPEDNRVVAIATWSLVHGLASLLIDGRIALPDGADAESELIEQVLGVHKAAFD
jgi:AcrR family transcriptional regulator